MKGKLLTNKKTTLAAVIGAAAAALLVTFVAREESGGKQYLRAYLDIANTATICDGLTRYADGRRVRMGDRATEAECEAMLDAELAVTARKVLDCTPNLKGRDNQTIAAITLAYNIGTAGYCKSSVDRHFDAGRWRQGCDAMLAWNKARVNGVLRPVLGLTNRRQRERALCLKGL